MIDVNNLEIISFEIVLYSQNLRKELMILKQQPFSSFILLTYKMTHAHTITCVSTISPKCDLGVFMQPLVSFASLNVRCLDVFFERKLFIYPLVGHFMPKEGFLRKFSHFPRLYILPKISV